MVSRLHQMIVERNRKLRAENKPAGKIVKVRVGVKEANEIMHHVAECFPNCPYTFGFDSIGKFLRIDQHQFEVVLVESLLEIVYDV